MSAPGILTWMQPATGLLRLGVMINGILAVAEDCTVDWQQTIEPVYLLQGGVWASVFDIKEKHLSFKITMPLRVDRSGNIESATWQLLSSAQTGACLQIDTNHALSSSYLTAEANASDFNELLGFDSVVVKSLKVSSDEARGVMVTADLEGRVNARAASAYVIPSDSYMRGGRTISFNECRCSKFYSQLRNAMKLEVGIESKVLFAEFIPPATADNRDPSQNQGNSFVGEPNYAFMPDQSGAVAATESKFTGMYEEMVRLGADQESYVHGGYGWRSNGSIVDNLTFTFGPLVATIATPIYRPTQQKLSATLLKRSVQFFAVTSPIGADFFSVN